MRRKFFREKTPPPLTLSCGHALCKMCTCKLELENNRKFPKCEETWTKDLVEPSFANVVKMLCTKEKSTKTLTVEEEQQEKKELLKKTEPQQFLCADHCEIVQSYCASCEELLCIECITSKHRTHDLFTIKKNSQKVKAAIRKALDEAKAKSTQEAKLVDKRIEASGQNKDLLQSFEIDVASEKNIQKNI